MTSGSLRPQLFKAILLGLVGLLLYGFLPGGALLRIAALLVGVRLGQLVEEALRRRMTALDWETLLRQWRHAYERFDPAEKVAGAVGLGLAPDATDEDLAAARVRTALQAYRPPRARLHLMAEAIGVVTFVLLLPAAVALHEGDFFSLRMGHGWEGAAVVVLGVALWAWPHLWADAPGVTRRRLAWWTVPFVPALGLVMAGIGLRHPYLDPTRPDRAQLAADRVLALRNNILAGNHADWVLRYAREVDARGEKERAIHYYREGLRLDANDADAQDRLTALSGGAPDTTPATRLPDAPYWTDVRTIPRAERRAIDATLKSVAGCTVVLVPIGEVPGGLLDAIAFTLRQELQLPSVVATGTFPLPVHTRVRGLLTGRQWDCTAIVRAFQASGVTFPDAPLRYLLVTAADLYMEESNYVFSASFEWGGVVSCARFGEPGASREHRTAKQCLCTMLKSFRIPMSPQRECVTSYTRSLDEFDAKGNRPCAAVLGQFQSAVSAIDAHWREVRRQ